MGPHSSKHDKHRSHKPPKQPIPSNSMSKSTNRQYNSSELAVITVIFNPVKYRSRYEHYNRFAAHMAQSGVHLYTVECIFESAVKFGLPRQDFEITQPNNQYHIQLQAPSILWMKENLINVVVSRLPQHVNYVAWIDGDIEFERSDWVQLTLDELQRYPVVQLFELSFFLGPGGKKDILRRDYSFGYSIRHNKPIDPKRYDQWYAHPGYAWAMQRSAFNQIGGLIDCCIIGSGDLHFAFALLNRIDETIRPNLHPDYRNVALEWGKRVAQVAQNGINVSYIAANIFHHWHGNRNDRNYVDRWMILEKHQFSPLNDLEKHDNTGLIRLADKKNSGSSNAVARIDALERDIVAYFISRKEDTNVKTNQVVPPQPPNKAKPYVAGKTQPSRTAASGGSRSTGFKPNIGFNTRPTIWSSGPAGTHVDDHDPYWDQCCCPEHHHCPDNTDCPCSPNHYDDQHCWNPSEDDHHHHQDHDDHHHHQDHDDHHHHHHDHDDHHHHQDHDDHHHHQDHDDHHHHQDHDDHQHHHDDSSAGHHWSNDNDCHQDYSNTDNSGFNYDHSSGGGGGGGGHDHTDYSGPGSFY